MRHGFSDSVSENGEPIDLEIGGLEPPNKYLILISRAELWLKKIHQGYLR